MLLRPIRLEECCVGFGLPGALDPGVNNSFCGFHTELCVLRQSTHLGVDYHRRTRRKPQACDLELNPQVFRGKGDVGWVPVGNQDRSSGVPVARAFSLQVPWFKVNPTKNTSLPESST